MKISAYGDSVFKGEVSRIMPQINQDRKTFQVQVLIKELSTKYLGISAEANILVAEKKRALSIPTNFIQNGDSLWVKINGDFSRIKVKVGVRDGQYVEILDQSITDKTIIGRERSSSFKF